MAAATSQPLYSLDPPAFQSAIQAYMAQANPDLPPGMAYKAVDLAESRDSSSALKSLPDLLAKLGNPVSCPFCAVPLVKGTTARLCLACGKPLGPLPAGTGDKWHGSAAERRFVASLNLHGDKRKVTSRSSPMLTPETKLKKLRNPSPQESALPDDFFNPPTLLGSAAEPGGTPVQVAGPDSTAASPMHDLHMFAAHSPNSSPIHEKFVRPRQISDKEDFFSQLSGLDAVASLPPSLPPSAAQPSTTTESAGNPVLDQLLGELPDLSFMLADRLLVPGRGLVLERTEKESQGGAASPGGTPSIGLALDPQAPKVVESTGAAVGVEGTEGTIGGRESGAQEQGGFDEVSDDEWGDFNS